MKCPDCGHVDRIHCGPSARSYPPGTCLAGEPDTPCECKGWRYWQAQDEWQQELQFEQDRVDKAFGRSMETLYEGDD